MPDITMCRGDYCPLKERCYRYTAKPSEYRQSYFSQVPIEYDVCRYFTPNASWDNLGKEC